jgi:hypothetical protein
VAPPPPAQEEEALHNLPITVGHGEVQELAEAAIHTTSARLEVAQQPVEVAGHDEAERIRILSRG